MAIVLGVPVLGLAVAGGISDAPDRAHAAPFREGRVIRFEWFVDPEQAFARHEPPAVRPLKSAQY
jgi:hypothetical protein